MDRTIESILVPTDGSECAETAARRGIGLAAAIGADLHVLSVVDTREVDPPLSSLDPQSESRRSCATRTSPSAVCR